MTEIINAPADFTPADQFLKNKTILITGAGGAIGSAIAKTYASYGATTILHGKTIPKLEKVYDEIVEAGYPQPAIVLLDLETASEAQFEEMANLVENEFGVLDGLVHNAAFFAGLIPIAQFETKLWAQIMQVNVNAPFMLSRAMLKLLNKSDSASVIFTSSGVAHQGRAYWGAYGVSKAAGDNLMGILADELETNTNIRVNSIDPGRVRTPMRALAFPGEDPNILPTPQDIMPTYLYLMSEDSEAVNSKILKV